MVLRTAAAGCLAQAGLVGAAPAAAAAAAVRLQAHVGIQHPAAAESVVKDTPHGVQPG